MQRTIQSSSTYSDAMASFKFNFTIPEDPENNQQQLDGSHGNDGSHGSDRQSKISGASETPGLGGSCSTGLTTSPTTSSFSIPETAPLLTHDSCKLNEVLVEPFHEQLLNFVAPVEHRPPMQTQGSVTLHYVTAGQLQTLLKAEKTCSHAEDSTEQVSNLISDTKAASMLTQLSSELGLLVGVADSAHSDLIPGVYEGGMKVWECAHDLVDYLATESSISLQGCRVLELGCGVGLPGIFALLSGAKCIHFQDFNREVLSCLTIPSVLASLKSGQARINSGQTTVKSGQACFKSGSEAVEQDTASLISRIRFYFGDWAEFALAHTESGESPYDIILTSETIYSVPSQLKLLQALKQLASPRTGIVMVAAKTHYFGVGGSVQMFEDLVARDGHFEVALGQVVEASVPRKILMLKSI